jgi:hypothetical protein
MEHSNATQHAYHALINSLEKNQSKLLSEPKPAQPVSAHQAAFIDFYLSDFMEHPNATQHA